MTSEVREAAGRLRWLHQWDVDIQLVANYVLAEHADDDELPIDEAWLRSVGFEEHSDDDRYFRIVRLLQLSVGLDNITSELGWCMRGQEFLTAITTRGQLRRLCAALNIPLEPIGQEGQS